ncbi:MAG: hypothetical protein U5J98_01620 [Halobacteriales archaeon]|nr:hypothetical protein [Halobacteriales archaeon]
MAEAYSGLVGAYGYALRRSGSWLLRTYVVASAAFGVYISMLLLLALISWIASPVAFGERAFLGVIGLLVLLPLFAPVLVSARRHRRGADDPEADRWLAVGGFAFVAGLGLALFVSDPSPHAVQGAFGPAAAWLDELPDRYGLLPPALAAVVIVAIIRLTRPSGD